MLKRFAGVILTLTLGSLGVAHAQLPPDVQIFHLFSGGSSGNNPVSSLIQTPDGGLVGLSFGIGPFQGTPGLLYKISSTGVFTTLHTFPADGSQGSFDNYSSVPASIIQASDRSFYGTFPSGGEIGAGTLFRISPTGVYNQLHDFSGDGNQPMGPLVEGFDQNLYGVVTLGPARAPGAIFRVGLNGSFAYVYVFDPSGVARPNGGLALGSDGNFYGTAGLTLYQFDPVSGTLNALGSVLNPNEIASVVPVLGPDNRAYFNDTSSGFCTCPAGALVSLGLDGSELEFNHIYQSGGASPNLTLAGDGNFYSAEALGAYTEGAVVNLTSQLDAAFSLAGVGSFSQGNLVQISNGRLAGTALAGGAGQANAGTVFLWNAGAPKPAPAILGFRPLTASVGQKVTVWGSFLVGTNAISVNGTPASFKTAASGFVNFTVPAGAASGPISITNAGGTTSSAEDLAIR